MSIPLDFKNPAQVKLFVEESLAANPRRVLHIMEIARRVRQSGKLLGFSETDLDLSECAALLHDIGYWQPIATTGFHPVDGANFLKEQGQEILADLIIGHSCSPEEGKLMGFDGIEQSKTLIGKLITYWDVQVKQGGEVVSYKERFEDIINRYGVDSIVGRANILAKPRIEAIVNEIDQLLAHSA
jgi:hypothetical protein